MKKLLTSLAALLALSNAAFAQVPVNPPAGGLTQAAADLRYCRLAGCTMTAKLTVNVADSTTGLLVAGATDGVRIVPNPGWSSIEFYDQTGAANTRAGLINGASLGLTIDGTTRITLNNSGHLTWNTDNTNDIGAAAATRPRDFYLGRNALVGGTLGVTGATTLSAALTYGGVTLSNAVTGTGNMVLSAGPTLTGTTNFATLTGTGAVTAYNATAIPSGGTTGVGFSFSSTSNLGVYFGSGAPTLTGAKGAQYLRTGTGTIYSNVDGSTNWIPTSTQMMSPVTTTSTTYTWGSGDAITYFNAAGTVTVTLPNPANFPHRVLYMKTITAQLLNSASSNVVPLTSTTAGTAILAATAGKWAVLVSDGTNWTQMAGN